VEYTEDILWNIQRVFRVLGQIAGMSASQQCEANIAQNQFPEMNCLYSLLPDCRHCAMFC
jgi:hypothetical protein